MTGPAYPPLPETGSNAIGKTIAGWDREDYKHRLFSIGIGQIGSIQRFTPRDTVISEYSNSPIICGLVDSFGAWMNPDKMTDEFYDKMWNIQTAQGYGLDVWGRIVGVSRVVTLLVGKFWGFSEPATGSNYARATFGHGPFYSGVASTTNYAISDTAYRSLILTKAAVNITSGSIPALNQLLLSLFPDRGNCYVRNDGGMAMTYVFDFPLSDVESAIVSQSGVLPEPCGVTVSVEINS